MNLPYKITKEEIQAKFEQFGSVEQVDMPLQKGGLCKGFAFVRYANPESAVNAYSVMDRKIF